MTTAKSVIRFAGFVLLATIAPAMVACSRTPEIPTSGSNSERSNISAVKSTASKIESENKAEIRRTMAYIPAGVYRPVYSGPDKTTYRVGSFLMDRYAVTNQEFLQFTAANPRWARGRPPAIKADAGYLRHWSGKTPSRRIFRVPVVYVSWFAARAYCRARGKRLPTVSEWERAASAPDAAHPNVKGDALTKKILAWYGRPNKERPVGSVYKNVLGLHDMHGSVWEWSEDFNSTTIAPDGRGGGNKLFCGGAGYNSSNPRDYTVFMRSAMRGALRASSTTANLGFRCARDIQK